MKAVALILLILAVLAAVAWFSWIEPELRRRADNRPRAWDWYSVPCGKNYNDWEIGVKARTRDGVEKHVVREWKGLHPDVEERAEVEGIAMTLAATFNSSREHRI